MLPYFRKLESQFARRFASCTAPTGPSRARTSRGRHELIEAIIAGAGSLGVPRNDDFNGERQEGVGYYQLFTRKGWRSSTAVAYLKPARGRPNLRVETDAHATRVLFEGTRATGVEYRQHGRLKTARAAPRGDPRRGRAAEPAAAAALGRGAGARCFASTASRWWPTAPAWARTCRTTCSFASSSSARSPSPPTTTSPRGGGRRRSGCSGCSCARARSRSASTRAGSSRACCRSRPGPTSSSTSPRSRRTSRARSRIRSPASR